MKHYALDSSFIINFLAGDKKAAKAIQDINSSNLIMPAPARLETKRGTKNLGGFEQLEVKSFGEKESETALKIIKHLEKEGEMIGIIDVMIASIATTNSAKIITFDSDFNNLEKFEGFEYRCLQD